MSPCVGTRHFFLCGIALLQCVSHAWKPDGVDPYEALGLERGSDLNAGTLKKAYRKAALRWHPDKAPADEKEEAERRFLEVTWAYETLSDPQQRAHYERAGAGKPAADAPGGEAGEKPSEWKRSDFSMKDAAEVFRKAFGEESSEYGSLVNHLLQTAGGGGDAEHWRRHAERIVQLTKGKGGDFTVETVEEGAGKPQTRTKTSRTVKDDGKGTRVETTQTVHSSSTSSGDGSAFAAMPDLAGHEEIMARHKAGLSSHDDIMAHHKEMHEAALKAAKLGGAGRAGLEL